MLKSVERFGKRGLMRAFGAVLRAPAISPAAFRHMRFERILVVRQHHQMGDMMLATPALHAIRDRYPDAEIGVVTSTLNREVLLGHPWVDHVFTLRKRDPLSPLRLVRDLRRARFDLAIALHTMSFSVTTLLATVLSGARVRIGSTRRELGDSLTGSYLNITLPLPDPETLATMNEAEHNLYPLRAVGIDTDDLSPLLVPTLQNEEWAAGFAERAWAPGTVRLAVHPGAGKVENVWPPARFAAVVNALAGTHRVSVLAVQGPRDEGPVAEFVGAVEAPVSVAAGRSIGDVAALLQRADLLVCNDTGVMHVAAAAGARALAIFGRTDPVRWAPRCANLTVVRSPDGTLSGVTVEAVVKAAEARIASIAAAQGDL
jgi:ADP-heptose:LPS heptosyltransferase